MRKRRDNRHAEIRDGLRQAGYITVDTADLGQGFPDILCCSKTRIPVLIEIKTDKEDFTLAEREFFEDYPGPKAVAMTLESALATMQYYDGFQLECK